MGQYWSGTLQTNHYCILSGCHGELYMYESVYMCLVSSILLLCHQGFMLVYDVTQEKSFDNIRNWIRHIEEVIRNY